MRSTKLLINGANRRSNYLITNTTQEQFLEFYEYKFTEKKKEIKSLKDGLYFVNLVKTKT